VFYECYCPGVDKIFFSNVTIRQFALLSRSATCDLLLNGTYYTTFMSIYCLSSTCLVLTKGAIMSILAWIHGPIAMINDVVAMERP
jgi:hypothetical protein